MKSAPSLNRQEIARLKKHHCPATRSWEAKYDNLRSIGSDRDLSTAHASTADGIAEFGMGNAHVRLDRARTIPIAMGRDLEYSILVLGGALCGLCRPHDVAQGDDV